MPATWIQHGSGHLDSAKHAKLVDVTMQPLTAVEVCFWSLSNSSRLEVLSRFTANTTVARSEGQHGGCDVATRIAERKQHGALRIIPTQTAP